MKVYSENKCVEDVLPWVRWGCSSDESDRKNSGAADEPGGTPCWFPLQAAKGEGPGLSDKHSRCV